MEFNINANDKIIEIWLTNKEKQNTALLESLKPVFALHKSKKYTVAVFESGCGDLFDSTRDLLLRNRYLSAENGLSLQI